MKWKTATNRVKDIPMHNYLVDWDADQGSVFSADVLAFLEKYWKYDIVCAEVPVAGTLMRYDFVNVSKRIVLETDGEQHSNPKNYYNQGIPAKWLAQIKRDVLKDSLAHKNGFKMIRIKPTDLPLTKEWFKITYDVDL